MDNKLQPTLMAKGMFPQHGFALFPNMVTGEYELLRSIVKKESSSEIIFNIYKNHVCRTDEPNVNNFKVWLLLSIGKLVMKGYLRIHSTIALKALDSIDLFTHKKIEMKKERRKK